MLFYKKNRAIILRLTETHTRNDYNEAINIVRLTFGSSWRTPLPEAWALRTKL